MLQVLYFSQEYNLSEKNLFTTSCVPQVRKAFKKKKQTCAIPKEDSFRNKESMGIVKKNALL